MPQFNQKGAFQLILVVLLILGIGIGVYLVQFTQIFKPKATGNTPQKLTNENFEPTLNPFGDAWSWKKSPNPSLPVSVGGAGLGQYVSHHRDGTPVYQDSDGKIMEALAQYYAKTNSGYVYLDSFEPHAEGTNPRSLAVIKRAKEINPNIKFLGYYVQWEPPPGWNEILSKANAGDQHFENFFVHIEGRSPTKENRLRGRPDKPEWEGGGPVLDITNPNVRAYVAPKLVEAIKAAKMDGIMNDSLFINAADGFNPTNHYPDNIMPGATKDAWPASMAQFVEDIKRQMNGTNLEIFGNVNDDYPEFMKTALFSGNRLDGVIFEDPFNGRDPAKGLADHTAVSKVSTLMEYIDSVGKKAIHIVSGVSNGTKFAETTHNAEILAQRYFLAAFLMVKRDGNNMFEYHYPTSIFYQYNSQAMSREWDLNLGSPIGVYEAAGNGVLVRKFERGYVYWNPTNSNFTIQGGSGLYHIDNGQNIDGQVVPALSGAFFVTQDVLNEYNTPPPPPSPPPSPPPTVSPVVLTGTTECSGGKPRVVLKWNFVSFQNAELFKNPDPLPAGILVGGNLDRNNSPLYDTGSFSPVRPDTDYTYSLKVLDGTAAETTTNSITVRTPSAATCNTTNPTCASLGGVCVNSVNKASDGKTCSQTLNAGPTSDCTGEYMYCFAGSSCTNPPPLIPPDLTDKTLAYCNGNTSRIHLEWVQVPGATIYKIFKSTTQIGSGAKLAETGNYAYNDDSVIPGVEYQYSIEASNGQTSTGGQGINIKTVNCASPNPSQSPTPTPTRSPSPSTSPSTKLGDIDKDGDVDIFDYNLFIQDFITQNLRSDLNGDGVVNALDFNEFIKGFRAFRKL